MPATWESDKAFRFKRYENALATIGTLAAAGKEITGMSASTLKGKALTRILEIVQDTVKGTQ